jgi:hypothetical protein
MRWLYIYKGRATPSGGHKQVRLMASLVNAVGGQAFLLQDGATSDDRLYDVQVPTIPFSLADARGHVMPDDVLIFPEVNLEHYLQLTNEWVCRKAVNNQNGFYALEHRPRGGYRRRGIEFVLANAEYVAALTHRMLGLPPERVLRVPHWIDRPPFGGQAPALGERPLRVCYMPRKLPDHIAEVRRLTERDTVDFEWMALDNMPEGEVADALRSCRIFLSTQDREGCPLPALEAMSSGAIVVGYKGTAHFRHPYADATNGYWADDRQPGGAALQLRQALQDVRRPGASIEAMIAAGKRTVARFGREPVVQALRVAVDVVQHQTYESGQRPVARLGWRGTLSAAAIMSRSVLTRWSAR